MKKVINIIFCKINRYISRDRNTCRLLEIDLCKQEVKFQIKMKLPVLRCSISHAINELNLVDYISATEACYLGGYYGRILSASWYNNDGLKKADNVMSFLIKSNMGRYQILYKNRSGEIGYYDKVLQKEFTESPLSIVNNEKLISLFNASQACYIGILAGLQFGKKASKRQDMDGCSDIAEKKHHLRIVK